MQNVGFLFCFYPALEKLYPVEEERREAVERHLDTVNTHPAMGTLLAGITARLERDLEPRNIIPYRKRVMATLAAQGDRIFWGHLRPLAAVMGVATSLCLFHPLAGCIALLVIYNSPQLLARTWGFKKGWLEGVTLLKRLNSTRVESGIRFLRRAISTALGVAAGLLVMVANQPRAGIVWDQIELAGIAGMAALSFGAFLLLRRNIALGALVYPAVFSAMVIFIVLNS